MKHFLDTERIVRFMKENNLSKTKFRKLCGISMQTLNKVLVDDLSLRVTVLWKLAKGMNVDLKDLVCQNND